MGKDKEISGVSVLLAVGFLIPIYMCLAPKDIRAEVFDYTSKFVGTIVLLIGAYMLYSITIKDKISKHRRKKEQEELERWQREQRQRWNKQREEKEKNKRED
jgi:rRNA processing protein Gar1